MVHVNAKVTGLLMSLKAETGNQNRGSTRDIHHKQRERQIRHTEGGSHTCSCFERDRARSEERGKMKEDVVRANARAVACLGEYK